METNSAQEVLEKKRRRLQEKLENPDTTAHMRRYVLQVEGPRVELALKRLKAGEYGICEDCGEQIPEKRLRAIPEIGTCKGCERPETAFRAP